VFLWFFAQEREEAAADMEMATRSIEEKVELESMLAELKATVASQQKEIVDRELHISSLDQQLKVTNRTLDDLQLELSRSTSAVQVSDRFFFRTVTKNPPPPSNSFDSGELRKAQWEPLPSRQSAVATVAKTKELKKRFMGYAKRESFVVSFGSRLSRVIERLSFQRV